MTQKKKNEEEKALIFISQHVFSKGREQSESKWSDSDFHLSVHEWHILFQLLTGWCELCSGVGSEGYEKEPLKGEILFRM